MPIAMEEMRSRLLSVPELRESLSVYEPLGARGFPVGPRVHFRLEPGWNIGDLADPTAPVNVFVRLLDDEVQLTLEATQQATSLIGLSKGFVMKTPANLVQDALNYYYREGFKEGAEYQVLSVEGSSRDGQPPLGVGFTRGSIRPFSSLRLLDAVLEKIRERYGVDESALFVDYKMAATLPHTAFSLIIPEVVRQMQGTGLDDDPWSAGIRITNSPVGRDKTAVEGYTFRYTCTNGNICVGADGGEWSRRAGQGEEVYQWAAQAVDAVIGGFESELDAAQALVGERIEGEAADVLQDLYEHFKLPVPVRDAVTENMVEVTDLTMYNLQAAITEVANDPSLSFGTSEQLMRVGGFVSHAVASRCGSCHQILRRGHRPHPEQPAGLVGPEETDEAGNRQR